MSPCAPGVLGARARCASGPRAAVTARRTGAIRVAMTAGKFAHLRKSGGKKRSKM